MLEPLGINESEEALYRALLVRPDATLAELADATGHDESRLRRQLRPLETRGLVTRTPTRPVRFRPAPPNLALDILAAHRHREIEQARSAAAELTSLWQAAVREREPPVQVIAGNDANVQHFLQTQLTTTTEVLIFDRPPYVMEGVARQTVVELELLARGVRYRTIYDHTSLAGPEQIAVARTLAQHGEQARVLNDLPMKMLIADRALALVPVVLSAERQTVVLRQSPLLDALITLFDTLWEKAAPLWPGGKQAAYGLSEQDEHLLGLAAAGYTDEAISRKLGLAQRTIERRMHNIMQLLDARTRFQAGLQAAQRGILGP